MSDGPQDHQIRNMVTAWRMRDGLDGATLGGGGPATGNPLVLPVFEYGNTFTDYSVLQVRMPPAVKQRQRNEPEDMLQPLAQMCRDLGEKVPEGEWAYKWYYFELLDRDEKVQPLCWINSDLLHEHFPDDREASVRETGPSEVAIRPAYSRQLGTMDYAVRAPKRTDRPMNANERWWKWLLRTWRENEARWLKEGLVTYKTIRGWSQMLDFDKALADQRVADETEHDEWDTDGGSDHVSFARREAAAGHGGLYWRMIPLYDRRMLPKVWNAMKHDLFATSVFNMAAGVRQDERLWKRMTERFVLPFPRMSRYRYLVRRREQAVLQWTRDEGRTLDEIAWLLIDNGLHCLDEAEAKRISKMARRKKERYFNSARSVAIRIRRRLHKDDVIPKGKPGRPKRNTE